jgi:hypothetical protein
MIGTATMDKENRGRSVIVSSFSRIECSSLSAMPYLFMTIGCMGHIERSKNTTKRPAPAP